VALCAILFILLWFVSILFGKKGKKRQQYKSKAHWLKAKGDKYEIAVGKEFERKGYRVFYQGLKKGKADGGIDLIAYNKKELILIQCKNQKDDVQQNIIRKFLGDCAVWESENKQQIKKRTIKRYFISSAPLSVSAKIYLQEHNQCRFFQMRLKWYDVDIEKQKKKK